MLSLCTKVEEYEAGKESGLMGTEDHIDKPEVYKVHGALSMILLLLDWGGLVEEVAYSTQIMERNNNII